MKQFEKLQRAVSRLCDLLDEDRTPRAFGDDEGDAANQSPKPPAGKKDNRGRPMPHVFGDIYSDRLHRRRWAAWIVLQSGDIPKAASCTLSLYDLHEILRAFESPLKEGIESLQKFRHHRADDPVLSHLGQVAKGRAEVRYAALTLDQAIDQFTNDFRKVSPRLSRDKLVSIFLRVLHSRNHSPEQFDYRAVNRICRPLRK